MPHHMSAPILGAMTVTTTTRLWGLPIVLLMLASACGNQTPQTLGGVETCLKDHGARISTTSGSSQDDPDAQVIADFIGYQGSITGTFRHNDFTVDVYDTVWLTPVGADDSTFQTLHPCFDRYNDPTPVGDQP